PHNVVRGLVGAVYAVAVSLTPLAFALPFAIVPSSGFPLKPPQRRYPTPCGGICPASAKVARRLAAGRASARGGAHEPGVQRGRWRGRRGRARPAGRRKKCFTLFICRPIRVGGY